jgi:hypothetical protein
MYSDANVKQNILPDPSTHSSPRNIICAPCLHGFSEAEYILPRARALNMAPHSFPVRLGGRVMLLLFARLRSAPESAQSAKNR